MVGGTAGLIEALVSMTQSLHVIRPSDIFAIVCFYAIAWGGFCGVGGLLHMLISSKGRISKDIRTTKSLYLSAAIATLLFVLVGGYANATWLPSVFSKTSLLFDAGLLLVCTLVRFVLYRMLTTFMRPQHRYVTFKGPVVICFFAFLGLLGIFYLLSMERGRTRGDSLHQPTTHLNVLMLVMDAVRADHLGCYGYWRATSPHIDLLASQGILFLNAYTQAPLTKQSVASIWTSLYPTAHNVRGIADGLPANALTFMEAMKAAGYRTGVFAGNGFVSPLFGFDRGVDLFYCQKTSIIRSTILGHVIVRIGRTVPHMDWVFFLLRKIEFILPLQGQGGPYVPVDAEGLHASFLQWIDAAPQRPFIAYIHYMETHAPYASQPEFIGLFDPDYSGPPVVRPPQTSMGLLPYVKGQPLDERTRTNLVANYDGAIRSLDRHIKNLLDTLTARGILEHTLVIVTADHGEEFWGTVNPCSKSSSKCLLSFGVRSTFRAARR